MLSVNREESFEISINDNQQIDDIDTIILKVFNRYNYSREKVTKNFSVLKLLFMNQNVSEINRIVVQCPQLFSNFKTNPFQIYFNILLLISALLTIIHFFFSKGFYSYEKPNNLTSSLYIPLDKHNEIITNNQTIDKLNYSTLHMYNAPFNNTINHITSYLTGADELYKNIEEFLIHIVNQTTIGEDIHSPFNLTIIEILKHYKINFVISEYNEVNVNKKFSMLKLCTFIFLLLSSVLFYILDMFDLLCQKPQNNLLIIVFVNIFAMLLFILNVESSSLLYGKANNIKNKI